MLGFDTVAEGGKEFWFYRLGPQLGSSSSRLPTFPQVHFVTCCFLVFSLEVKKGLSAHCPPSLTPSGLEAQPVSSNMSPALLCEKLSVYRGQRQCRGGREQPPVLLGQRRAWGRGPARSRARAAAGAMAVPDAGTAASRPRQAPALVPLLLTEFQQRGMQHLAPSKGSERNIKQSIPSWDSQRGPG